MLPGRFFAAALLSTALSGVALADEPPTPAAPAAPVAPAAPAAPVAPEAAPAAPVAPVAPPVNRLAEARALRAKGDHAGAARAFAEAYAQSCDPSLLHDTAVEFDTAKDPRHAVAYYGRYMAEAKDAPSDVRHAVARRIGQLHLKIERQDAPDTLVQTEACSRTKKVAKAAPAAPSAPGAPAAPSAPTAPAAPSAPDSTSADTALAASVTPSATDPRGAVVELQLQPGADWRGQFQLGFDFGRITAGLGLELYQESETVTQGNTEDSTTSTALLLIPGVRIDLAESADGRVQAFGSFDLGVGTVFADSPPGTDVSTLLVDWRLGPGLRFWFHRQLAIGGVVGIGGDHVRVTTTDTKTDAESTHTKSTIATFATLSLLGRF